MEERSDKLADAVDEKKAKGEDGTPTPTMRLVWRPGPTKKISDDKETDWKAYSTVTSSDESDICSCGARSRKERSKRHRSYRHQRSPNPWRID